MAQWNSTQNPRVSLPQHTQLTTISLPLQRWTIITVKNSQQYVIITPYPQFTQRLLRTLYIVWVLMKYKTLYPHCVSWSYIALETPSDPMMQNLFLKNTQLQHVKRPA